VLVVVLVVESPAGKSPVIDDDEHEKMEDEAFAKA